MYDTVKGSDWLGMLLNQTNLSFYLQCSYLVSGLDVCCKLLSYMNYNEDRDPVLLVFSFIHNWFRVFLHIQTVKFSSHSRALYFPAMYCSACSI